MSSSAEGLAGSREGFTSSDAQARACGACGAGARRGGARFCSTCGRALAEDYVPADSLRASYRFESPHESYAIEAAREATPTRRRQGPRRVGVSKSFGGTASKSLSGEVMKRRDSEGARRRDFDGARPRRVDIASSSALACVAYALVPYLGILFCPGAMLFGGVGLVRSWRTPQARRDSALGLALGVLILCAQLVLWWILYKVPEWSRQGNF